MNIFNEFPQSHKCPICGTKDNKKCILVPIYEKDHDDSNLCQAIPVHLDCMSKNAWYMEEQGCIVLEAKFKTI